MIALAALLAWAVGGGTIGFAVLGTGAVLALFVGGSQPPSQGDRSGALSEPGPGARDQATEALPLVDDPRLAALFDALSDPVLGVRGGRLRWANRQAALLFGDHAIGGDVRMAIRHPAAFPLLRAEQGPPGPAGSAALPGYGEAAALWRIDVVRLADGGLVAMLTDTGAIAAAERARSDFVANASHELRTPLSAIIGYLETLADPEVADDVATRDRFLAVASREAGRMVRLLDDLFSLSRIHADRNQPPTDAVDLSRLIGDVVADLPDSPPGRAADVAVSMAVHAMVPGDPVQLAQGLRNVVVNAMKYGTPGTAIDVTVVPDGDHVMVTVADQSEGIAPRHLPRLTERFYRADPARSRTLGGTGLGLAIVKHIVERHRGRLFIDSQRGVGTTVAIRLPALAKGVVPAPDPEAI